MSFVAEIIIGAVFAFIYACIRITLFFLMHFDVTNSILVSGLIQMLTKDYQWNSNARIAMFIIIFAVCLILQNVSKIAKVIFGIFSALVIALFGCIWKTHDSSFQRIIVAIICFTVGLLLNFAFGAEGITKDKA